MTVVKTTGNHAARRWRAGFAFAVLASTALRPFAADAQTSSSPHVETILVTGSREAERTPTTGTHNFLAPESVVRLDASSSAEILRRMPSIHIPTNSRGESIVFLRNAGERQVAVFLGGAMLNVPWDNRFDMSMLPGSLVGSVISASGPLSAQYGVNALGAVNVILPDYRSGGSIAAEWGAFGVQRYEGVVSGDLGPVQLLAAAAHSSQDGEPLADSARLPFHQPDPDQRTNTDRKLTSFAGRAGFDLENGRIDATLVYNDGEKGIAPEGHMATGNRFWRYPDHRLIQGNLHANIDFTPDVNLTASAWAQDFRQTINQHTNATFATVLDREEDKDRTYGTRGVLTAQLGDRSQAAFSYNMLISTHVQRDTRFIAGALPATLPPWFTYSQRATSFGADFEHHITDALTAEIGGGLDWLDYTRTGDKPSIPDFVEPTFHGGLSYALGDAWRLRTGAGYKTRSPTMRDLFGVALNRFLLNPNLTAERVVNVEAGAEWHGGNATFSAVPFAQFVENTIDQRNVGALRQRVNLRGTRIYGIELNAAMQLSEEWSVAGNITASQVRRLRSAPTESEYLAEKPAVLAGFSVDYTGASGIDATVELDHTGRAYSANPTGTLVPLEISTQLNARLAFNLDRAFPSLPPSQIYIRADNLTDTFVEPQLGLPAPGRWIRGGVRIQW
jgi:iron complex outermembrane receptor protein